MSVVPCMPMRALEPLPAIGSGLTLSLPFVVPGVAVAPRFMPLPELVFPSAPARAELPFPARGSGLVASLPLVVPPIPVGALFMVAEPV